MANDALYSMLRVALFSAPIVLGWMVAIGGGISMLPKSRPAAICLMSAGGLELLRFSIQLAAIPLPVMLLDSGVLGVDALRWFALGRAVLSVALIVLSHIFLLFAIYGWRRR